MIFEDNDEILIVCDQSYFPIIFKYRNSNPYLNIKIISRSQFINKATFAYKSDALPALMKKGFDYSTSKKYLSYFQVADVFKNEKLSKTYSYISDLLVYNKLDIYELKNKKILFLELDEDIEITNIAKKQNLNYSKIHLSDLKIHKELNIKNITVFKNKYEQFKFIFSNIRKKLLENDSLKEKIVIFIKDENDLFYVNLFSKLFKIDVFYEKKENLLADSKIRKNVDEIYLKKSFMIENMEDDLKNIVQKFDLTNLDFKLAFSSLLEILSSITLKQYPYNKGILVTDKVSFNDDLIYYITCFQFNSFYKNFNDDGFLSDNELLVSNINPSYIKTKLDRRLKLNFLKQNNIFLLSRVEQHLNDSIYDSQFIEELNLKNKIVKYKENDDEVIYTDKAIDLYLRELHDETMNCNFNIDRNIRNYDFSFKGLNNFPYQKKKTYSVTDLESYASCPYKYYLSKVLPVTNDDQIKRIKGILIHSVFENFNHKFFDFNTCFQKAVEAILSDLKKQNIELSIKEKTYIDVIKKWLKIEIEIMRSWILDNHVSLIEEEKDHEIPIEYTLYDSNNNDYVFKGKIDSVVKTKSNDNIYYTIVDYKTGSEKFDVKSAIVGKSIQLPLYADAYINLSKNKEEIFGGFGIKTVYFTSPKKAFYNQENSTYSTSNLLNSTRVSGLAYFDESYVLSFDNTALNQTSKKTTFSKRGGKYLKIGTSTYFTSFSGDDNLINSDKESIYNFQDMIIDCKKAAIQIIQNINNMNFEIKPASINVKVNDKNNLTCSYCPYKNICYYDKSKPIQPYYKVIKNRVDNLRKKTTDSEE